MIVTYSSAITMMVWASKLSQPKVLRVLVSCYPQSPNNTQREIQHQSWSWNWFKISCIIFWVNQRIFKFLGAFLKRILAVLCWTNVTRTVVISINIKLIKLYFIVTLFLFFLVNFCSLLRPVTVSRCLRLNLEHARK